MIHTDCDCYVKDPFGRAPHCRGLTEMMCANGECKFYKTRDQVFEERKRCRERLQRIRYLEKANQKSVKEYTYDLFREWY